MEVTTEPLTPVLSWQTTNCEVTLRKAWFDVICFSGGFILEVSRPTKPDYFLPVRAMTLDEMGAASGYDWYKYELELGVFKHKRQQHPSKILLERILHDLEFINQQMEHHFIEPQEIAINFGGLVNVNG